MINGYFKGKEIEIASAVPEYKFMLPKNAFSKDEPTFNKYTLYKLGIAIYKLSMVTGKIAYYKFARYE